MKNITTEELKQIQICILQHIDAFCREHNLHYSISGGTLIGAVRHKGFIPWDDDIDIMMLREDYDRFIRQYSKEDNSPFHLYSNVLQRKFPYPFAKIDDSRTVMEEEIREAQTMGVNIDIFPIDAAPMDEEEQTRMLKRIHRLIMILSLKRLPIKKRRGLVKNFILALSHMVLSFYPTKRIIDSIVHHAKEFEGQETTKCGCFVWGYGKKEIHDTSDFSDYVSLEFEGVRFMALKGWHNYLTSLFGDYMQLPPIEERVSHHHFIAYWKE